MTQEEKQLLLIDLCGRLSYGLIIKCNDGFRQSKEKLVSIDVGNGLINYDWRLTDIKPYLRPLSSMTEEESAELSNIISEWFDKELFYLTEEPFLEYALSKINYSISPRLFDWLNKKMFDYRGLIEKGLAIGVTEDNNPYKD